MNPVECHTLGIVVALLTTFVIAIGFVLVDIASPVAIMVELVAWDVSTTSRLAFYERVLAVSRNNIASFFVEVAIARRMDPVERYTLGISAALLTTCFVTHVHLAIHLFGDLSIHLFGEVAIHLFGEVAPHLSAEVTKVHLAHCESVLACCVNNIASFFVEVAITSVVDPVESYTIGINDAQITTFLITVGFVMVDVSSPVAIMVELVAPDFFAAVVPNGHLALYERVLACCFNNIASFFVEVAMTSVVDPVKGYTLGILIAQITTFLITVGCVMVDVSSPEAIMVKLVAPDFITTFLLIRGHLAFYERVLACCFNNIASFFVEVAITSVVDPVKGYTFGIIGALLTTFLVTVGF